MIKKATFIFLLFILFFAGCENKSQDQLFLEMFPGVEFNQEITLDEDPFAPNNFLIGSEVDLILYNQSDQVLEFSIADSIFIFQFDEKSHKWNEIDNEFNYHGPSIQMQPKDTGGISDALIPVWPKITDAEKPVKLRIVVLSRALTQEMDDRWYGAYYDFILSNENCNN